MPRYVIGYIPALSAFGSFLVVCLVTNGPAALTFAGMGWTLWAIELLARWYANFKFSEIRREWAEYEQNGEKTEAKAKAEIAKLRARHAVDRDAKNEQIRIMRVEIRKLRKAENESRQN